VGPARGDLGKGRSADRYLLSCAGEVRGGDGGDREDRPQREPEGDPEFAPGFLVKDDD
jgi:hypothetical protein